MIERRALRIMVSRLERIERIRAVAQDNFEFVDDKRFCIRRMAVVEHVSQAMRVPVSPQLCRSVELAVRSLGFEAVKSEGRALYRRVKLKGADVTAALLASRELRRKERRA